MYSSCIGARERTNNIVGHLHHKKPVQFCQDRLGTNEGNDCLWSGRAWFAVGNHRHEEHRWDTGWLQRAVTYLFAEPLPDDL
eukprot:COSAG06_NODE_5085_length_3733_cov_22.728949_5_plen_82_part_00